MEDRHARQAERLLRRERIDVHEVTAFSFMKRYTPVEDKHSEENLYGAGILTLHLADGSSRPIRLHARNHPSAVVRYLVERGIPMEGGKKPERTDAPAQPIVFRRPSLLLFWQALLSLAMFCLGFYLAGMIGGAAGVAGGVAAFAVAVYGAYTLTTRYCYLTLDDRAVRVHSMGRELSYPYEKIRKINFDFAREPQHTHVMEVLEEDYRYHLFYIGRVPRSRLAELTEMLRRAGVDATCSLNPEKRYYEDVYHRQ